MKTATPPIRTVPARRPPPSFLPVRGLAPDADAPFEPASIEFEREGMGVAPKE
jgi:hypothetical protein